MSITDMAAGRMRPGRAFGQRQVPPLRPKPPSTPVLAPFLQACRAYLRQLESPADLWRHIAFSFAYLRALIELRAPRLPGLADLTRLGPVMLTQVLRFMRWGLASLLRVFERSKRISPRAVLHALLWSDASATFARLVAYVSALTFLAVAANYVVRATPALTEADQVPAAEWVNVAKPFPVFSIPMSELAEGGQEYALRRHPVGGGRQDILTWGDLKSRAPHLMVEVYRPGSEQEAFASAQEEIATRLENADLTELKAAGEMETKFGKASLVEFSLEKPLRQCLGFALAPEDPALQILGWHCSRGTAPAERNVVACAIDRLALVSAGNDPKLREFFARAEMRRHFCGQRSHLLTPTPKHGPSTPPPAIRRGRLAAG